MRLEPTIGFVIQYNFGSPHSSWNTRSEKLFKMVKVEYYTLVLVLVGNVGGTLGMFIGFIGTSEWLLDKVFLNLLAVIKECLKNKGVDKSNTD